MCLEWCSFHFRVLGVIYGAFSSTVAEFAWCHEELGATDSGRYAGPSADKQRGL